MGTLSCQEATETLKFLVNLRSGRLSIIIFGQKRKFEFTQTQISQLLDYVDTQTKAEIKAENKADT